jgi:hypothetical protein
MPRAAPLQAPAVVSIGAEDPQRFQAGAADETPAHFRDDGILAGGRPQEANVTIGMKNTCALIDLDFPCKASWKYTANLDQAYEVAEH